MRSFAIRSGLTKGRAVVVQAEMHAEAEAGESARARRNGQAHTLSHGAAQLRGDEGGRRYMWQRSLAHDAREGSEPEHVEQSVDTQTE